MGFCWWIDWWIELRSQNIPQSYQLKCIAWKILVGGFPMRSHGQAGSWAWCRSYRSLGLGIQIGLQYHRRSQHSSIFIQWMHPAYRLRMVVARMNRPMRRNREWGCPQPRPMCLESLDQVLKFKLNGEGCLDLCTSIKKDEIQIIPASCFRISTGLGKKRLHSDQRHLAIIMTVD